MGVKIVYKKSLAIGLIKLGHDLEYTARNRSNPKYQVYFFIDSKELRKSMAKLTGKEYTPNYEKSN